MTTFLFGCILLACGGAVGAFVRAWLLGRLLVQWLYAALQFGGSQEELRVLRDVIDQLRVPRWTRRAWWWFA